VTNHIQTKTTSVSSLIHCIN